MYITTVNDLYNWVKEATTGWDDKESYLDEIVEKIRDMDDCPNWGDDWSDFLDGLPELHKMVEE